MAMAIELENTDIGDLFVSVWDINLAGAPKIVNAQRINEGQKFSIRAETDGDGYYNIRWYAERTINPEKSKQEDVRRDDPSTVDVSTYFS